MFFLGVLKVSCRVVSFTLEANDMFVLMETQSNGPVLFKT